MIIDNAFWGEYVPSLYSADSAEERFLVYENYILELGFCGATYTFTPRIQLEAMTNLPLIFLHSRDYPLDFLKEYQERRFDREGYDFAVNKSLQGKESGPMDWREHEVGGTLDEKELYLIHLAREKYNIKNAISIPTMLDKRGAAGVSVISFKEDKSFQETKLNGMNALMSATRLFHDTNLTDIRKFILPIFKNLTSTEILVLQYKANGQAMKNINDYIDITPGAASNLLTLLRRRLGGINNDRLMYLFGLLTDIERIPTEGPPVSM